MTTKRLFIVAGVSGSGKSTLLRLALENNIPLFGNEVNSLFQKTKAPEYILHESEFSFEEHIKNGFWFQAMHIKELSGQSLESVVIHLDLGNILTNIIRDDFYIDSRDSRTMNLIPKDQKNAINAHNNEVLFSTFLQNSYFKSFSQLYFHTLYSSRRTVEKNLKSRNRKWYGRKFLNWATYTTEKSHNAIYKSWEGAVAKLSPEESFISKYQGDDLIIEGLGLPEPLFYRI